MPSSIFSTPHEQEYRVCAVEEGQPYQVGKEVWVKAKVTRIAPWGPALPALTLITVEMPNGNKETMGLNEDKVRPAEES